MGSARSTISSEFCLSVLATASFFKGFGICTSGNGLLWYPTGHPTSQSRWLSTSVSLTGSPQRRDRIWDIPLPLLSKIVLNNMSL